MATFWLLLLFFTVLILSYIIYSGIQEAEYFKSRNIFYLGNGYYIFLIQILFQGTDIATLLKNQYDLMRKNNVKFGGNVSMGSDAFTIADLGMAKQIFVKDFDHFVNRGQPNFITPDDILVKKMLIFLTDEEWKMLRSKMSPTFTTGKIKRMFSLFNASSKKLVKYFEERVDSSEVIDMVEGYSKFTMDTIASTVCAMDSKAFDQIQPSVFEQMGKKLQVNFSSAKKLFSLTFMMFFPTIAGKFGMSLFDIGMQKFFNRAIKASIKHRRDTGEKGNDFIQLLLEAREGQLKIEEGELDTFEKDAVIKEDETNAKSTANLDDDTIVANCLLFILAGFDTTQSLLLFCAYALALHSEVQDKLRSEIEETLDQNEGEFTYESLHKMVYLDMVINETLRQYPPAALTDRGCLKDYALPGTDIVIQKGSRVTIPIIGIHHDPEYYPEPEKFDPERFSPENKGTIPPYAFLPFGHGPRNCIGMRFALTEVKLAIAQLVRHFSIEPSQKTMIPMQYENAGSLKPKGGMWLALKRRS